MHAQQRNAAGTHKHKKLVGHLKGVLDKLIIDAAPASTTAAPRVRTYPGWGAGVTEVVRRVHGKQRYCDDDRDNRQCEYCVPR